MSELHCVYCGRRNCFWRFRDMCQGQHEDMTKKLRQAEEDRLRLEKELRAVSSPGAAFESGWTAALLEVQHQLEIRHWQQAAAFIEQLWKRGPPK